ncbi:MAG: ABC transporter ATP-binding protein, partial [Pseudobutyrivibrio sp.]|nr:ABC transporter ATP-binding protein [Pseudobutyrivibrio sp.]
DAKLVAVPVDTSFDEESQGNTTNRKTGAEENQIRPKSSVELSNITYAYPGSPVNVLEDANMEIPIGKSVGIVGTSGAGKTTAVDVMLGLLKPSKGVVLSDGKDIQSDYPGWLQCVAYIPQTIFLTDDSIRANVAFGIKKEDIDEDALWRALDQAQLGDFVRSLPDGLDNQVGERGVRLSGGQRQRIGVARALYKNPEILVFDEATSALDNETESAIMESINALHGEKTLIIIAHRLTTIEGCDMVYRVGDGKITRER